MGKLTTLIVTLLVAVLFVAINVLATSTLGRARIDLTEQGIYTLSEAAGRVARSPAEPIRLRLYISRGLVKDIPGVAARADFIEEKLRQFELASDGKVILEVIDPEPSSEAEDRAIAEGLTPLPTQDGNVFLGLLATNTLEGRELIPVFNIQDPQLEQFLEFEIARIIDRLANTKRPTLGLISPIQLQGQPPNPALRQPGSQPFRVIAEIEQQFDVVRIDEQAAALPDDLDALLVVHPKNLGDSLLYSIDQYLLAGRPAAFFLDPVAELDTIGADPREPMSVYGLDRASQTIPTLEAWGVSLREDRVALDLGSALQFPSQQQNRTIPALQYLALTAGEGEDSRVSREDPVTGRLNDIWVGTPGIIDVASDAPVDVEPLLRTTAESQAVPTAKAAVLPDQDALLATFVPSGERFTLAARVRGDSVPSAFPDGPPGGATDGEAESESDGVADDAESDRAPADANTSGHLSQSSAPVNIVVVADVDLIADDFWVREIRAGSMIFGYDQFSDSGPFVTNIVDQMAGSGDLITLRARGRVFRPLDKLDQMEREAQTAIAAETELVNEQIREAEQRISELQSGRTDSGEITSLYLTPEQQEQLEAAQRARGEGRTRRREVVYRLRRDIENLKTRVMLINTAMVPALLCLFALGLGGFRAIRRRADRRRGEG